MSIKFIKHLEFEYGEPSVLSPLITRVICNNPSPFTYFGTGTYIIGKNEVCVIDPGPIDDAHFEALKKSIGTRPVKHILITHPHGDHFPLCQKLKEWCGAPILAHARNDKRLDMNSVFNVRFGFEPDIALDEETIIKTADYELMPIFTPGHSQDHYCFLLKEEKALFSGDHIMGWSTTVIPKPDGNMSHYMQSLEKIKKYEFETIYPTHGAPINQPYEFIDDLYEHRLARDRQIIAVLDKSPSTVFQIVSKIYIGLPKELRGAAQQSVFAHLMRLIELGYVKQKGSTPKGAIYSSV